MINIKYIGRAVIALCVFLTVFFSINKNTGSDPRATLLVSESILAHGTIKLDSYGASSLAPYGAAIQLKNGHYYYYFPIGTSVVSIPFVATAKLFGLSMLHSEDQVQMVIAAITSCATFFLLFALAKIWLTEVNSLIIASVFWFGSSLASTAGTALWSHNFATLFALSSIYLSIYFTQNNNFKYWPLVSVSLFFAYICRPSMSILAPFVVLYIFSYSKSHAIKSCLLLACFLAAFVAFSKKEYGQFLPDYYLPSRLASNNFKEAFFGNLFSPARGILIYSSFVISSWLCIKCSEKSWVLKKTWLLIGLAWPLTHLFVISRFPHWWAGWSFGARLMTDILPGVFLLTIYTWPVSTKKFFHKISIAILSASCIFSVFVNTYQGLFNPYVAAWNSEPDIDKNPEYIFDWSYPQFLAFKAGHKSRIEQYYSGIEIPYSSDGIQYVGWSAPEDGHRWSSSQYASIGFNNSNPNHHYFGYLYIVGSTNGDQYIEVMLNGQKIFGGKFSNIPIRNWDRYISFPPSILTKQKNILSFRFPEAHPPGNGDPRLLSLDLVKLTIR